MQTGYKFYCLSYECIVNVGSLLHPLHNLLRVEHTPEKGGGKLKERIQMKTHRRKRYTPLIQNQQIYYTVLKLEWISIIDIDKLF